MFGQILYTQLKWSRAALAVLSIVAFVVPAALWRAMNDSYFRSFSAMEVMSGFATLGFLLAILAFFVGFILVAQTYSVDAAARHVYALSLPIPWSRYLTMRFGAGALLLVIPTVAMWLGCLFVLALIDVPSTLQAYPTALAFRFLLGSLVGYAVIFALQYLSGKRAAIILLVGLVSLSVLMLVAEMTGNGELTMRFMRYLFSWPGPFAVFGSEWTLIDV